MSEERNGPELTTTSGEPVDKVRAEQTEQTGQHQAYVILSEEERRKGFVRPVRRSYAHVGPPGPTFPTRPLTPEEIERFDNVGYVSFEAYPPGYKTGSVVGRYWSLQDLDRVGKGCRMHTSMSLAIAETYARSPGFYGMTYCGGCNQHLKVGEFGEFVWVDGAGNITDERVGT